MTLNLFNNFFLNFSKVRHAPEHEIEEPISSLENLIFEKISITLLFLSV